MIFNIKHNKQIHTNITLPIAYNICIPPKKTHTLKSFPFPPNAVLDKSLMYSFVY